MRQEKFYVLGYFELGEFLLVFVESLPSFLNAFEDVTVCFDHIQKVIHDRQNSFDV